MDTMNIETLTIDPEFKALLAPLRLEEFAGLEEDILRDGCRVPLDVWQGILIDGHNRYEICTRHGLPYKVAAHEFDSREDVVTWILRNQLNRRNQTAEETSYYRGKLYGQLKKQGERTDLTCAQNAHKSKTADIIAEQYGVNQATIRRDAEYARAVDAVAENVGQEVKQQILAGDLPLTKKDVVTLAALPVDEQREVLNADRSVNGWRATRDTLKFLANVNNARVEDQRLHERTGNGLVRGTFGTGENEWYTPAQYIDMARKVLGRIDLDPASSELANETVKAAEFYTSQDNGLTQDWHGNIWLNPPYSQPAIAQFAEKMVEEWQAQRADAAIVLTHNYTDTAWFQKLASHATAICFTRGRVRFVSADGEVASPTQGQAFFYFGSDLARFIEEFREIGFVVEVR